MAVLSLTSIRSDIAQSFPDALPQLEQATGEDEAQQIIEQHLSQALDAPGYLTADKVRQFSKIIRFFYPERFLESKLDDITSLFTQVRYLETGFHSLRYEGLTTELKGASKPFLISSKTLKNGECCGIGVYKENRLPNTWSPIRERLSYLVDKKNVPPTFLITTEDGEKASFQLYIEGSEELGTVRAQLSSMSFFSSHIRDLAFSEMRRLNTDPSVANILICPDEQTFKFIDGEDSFPISAERHRISCLFVDDVFRKHLSEPFSAAELSYIEQIDVEAGCALLDQYKLGDGAIKTHRCGLLLLKEVIPFNQKSPDKITLEDLLVIAYISDPHGYSFTHDILGKGYAYGPSTLFSKVLVDKNKTDELIKNKIDAVFTEILDLKKEGGRSLGLPNRDAVYNYYHDKSKALFFSYFRNDDGSELI